MISYDTFSLYWHQWTFLRRCVAAMETFPITKSFKNAKNVDYLGHQNHLILEPKMYIMKMKTCPQWLLKSTGIEVESDFCKFSQSIGFKLSNALSLMPIWCFNDILWRKLSEFFFLVLCWTPHPLTGFIYTVKINKKRSQ